jgi:hypothetical protein
MKAQKRREFLLEGSKKNLKDELVFQLNTEE